MANKSHLTTDIKAIEEAEKIGRERAEAELSEIKAQSFDREQRIAKCHEIIGQFKAAQMVSKFTDVSGLVWLKDIKDSKIYRDLPGIGTWENFCNYIGFSYQHIDEQLKNLSALGGEFLLTVSDLRVGYRDLRKLRQLSTDGTILITDNAIEISGERIPFDPDHKEDLQTAIEQILEETQRAKEEADATVKAKDKVLKDKESLINKQAKELVKFERQARQKELLPEEDAVLGQIENLDTELHGYLQKLETVFDALNANPFAGGVAAFITLMDSVKMRASYFREKTVTDLAPAGMLPEEEWEPGKGAAIV